MKSMKHIIPLTALLLGPLASVAAATGPSKPNIIFILADDLGWSDTTLYGNTKYYKTPNLERLARRGMVYTRAYSASPLCSPTRASIMTGQSPARIGITTPCCHQPEVRTVETVEAKAPPHQKLLNCISATRLNTNYFTLAEALKAAGYATAHFGKWHLGPEPYSPLQQGFDVDLPHTAGAGPAGSYVAPWKFKDFKENYPLEHIEDRMSEEAVKWMEQQKDHPFFMNYWQFSVHGPFNAKSNLIEKYRGTINPNDAQRCPTYAAMVESMDDAVGKLLDAVDRLGIADHTIIVFYSDNGGNMYSTVDKIKPTSNRPLRGGKATVYEGGVRVPCVVSWPKLTPPGSRNDTIIQSSDFYPTFVQLLGLKTQPGQIFDGASIADTFAGKPLDRQAVFTYFPHDMHVPDTLPPAVTVTTADWKLIRLFYQGENGKHAYQLYNLKDDLGEKRDLAAEQPERVKALDALIEKFLQDTKAVTPQPNPDYDPQAKPAPAKKSKQPAKKPAGGTGRQKLEAESDAGL
jgi:arylsulfatase A-like enzyme